jgi:hypothetical protein
MSPRIGLLVLTLVVAACGRAPARPAVAAPPRSQAAAWSVGFWAWPHPANTRYLPPANGPLVGALYVQVGQIASAGTGPAPARWPGALSDAAERWAVWRLDPDTGRPGAARAAAIARAFTRLREEARAAGRQVTGLQIDYDCPTEALSSYAAFLTALAGELPRTPISITALLDWFRPGTAIDAVVSRVSEFVPQFYDLRPPAPGAAAIAEPLDPSRWAPVFNRFGVPYRIGISAYGRVLLDRDSATNILADVTLMDLFAGPGIQVVGESPTPAGERRVIVRALRPVKTVALSAGEQLQVVLPTTKSVGDAYRAARALKGWCRGVVFFRWPTEAESATLTPTEVTSALDDNGEAPSDRVAVSAEDGHCPSRGCWDLVLEPGDRLPADERTFAIRASCEVQYFLPPSILSARATLLHRDEVRVQLPAYHGQTRVSIGRVMTACAARFSVKRIP